MATTYTTPTRTKQSIAAVDADGQVQCRHGRAAKRLTSSTATNPGRVFYGCDAPRNDPQSCKFFAWEDSIPGLAGKTLGSSSQLRQPTPPSSQGSSHPPSQLEVSPTPRSAHQSRLVPPLPNAPTRAPPILASRLASNPIGAAVSPPAKSSVLLSPIPHAPAASPAWNNARERAMLKAIQRAEDEDAEEEEDLEEVMAVSPPSARSTHALSAKHPRDPGNRRNPARSVEPGRPGPAISNDGGSESEWDQGGGIDWDRVDLESVLPSAPSTAFTNSPVAPLRSGIPRMTSPTGSLTSTTTTSESGGSGNLMSMFRAVAGGKRKREGEPGGRPEEGRAEKNPKMGEEVDGWTLVGAQDIANPFQSPPPSRTRPIMPDTPTSPRTLTKSPSDPVATTSGASLDDLFSPIKRKVERLERIIVAKDKSIKDLREMIKSVPGLSDKVKSQEKRIEELEHQLGVERRRVVAREESLENLKLRALKQEK